jgi:GAF domain-containing protein
MDDTFSKAFNILLVEFSARFANVPGDRVEKEIEYTLSQLIEFVDLDGSFFVEITDDGWPSVVCSVAIDGVEAFPRGPLPAFFSWYVNQAKTGKIIALRSIKDFPSEAAGEAEYFRRSGMRSQLGIPLCVGGRIVASIGFTAFGTTRTWPYHHIIKLKLLGEVLALAFARKRAEENLTKALAEIERLRQERHPTEHLLCSRFGLTATEARVALGIARGESLVSIAERHRVAVATARSQLKAVFSKLGTHRQAELVARLGGKLF